MAQTVMTTESILKEIEHASRRLAESPAVDYKKEMTDNLYPLLHLVTSSLGVQVGESVQRLDEVEAAVAEYLTSQESMILPELAVQVQAVFALAQAFCDSVASLGIWGDELVDMPTELRAQMEILRNSCTEVAALVEEVTLIDEEAEEQAEEEASDG